MRVDQDDKYADIEAYKKMMTARITRLVAIAVVFLGTFFFFIKLLFL